MEVVAVVYGPGSVAPRRIFQAARRIGTEIVWVVPQPLANTPIVTVLERLGTVVTGEAADVGLCRELQRRLVAGVVTFSEDRILLTAELASQLNLRYQDAGSIRTVRSKIGQRKRFDAVGIPSPRFLRLEKEADWDLIATQLRFPVVVKPEVGTGSVDTTLVQSAATLGAARVSLPQIDPSRPFIAEEYLPGVELPHPWGDYVGVDILYQDGSPRYCAITGKFALAYPFRERGGYCGKYAVPEATLREVEALALAATAAFGFQDGFAGVEIKLAPEGLRVIEVNGRLGAWVDELARSSGFEELVEDALRVALGRQVPPRPANDFNISRSTARIPFAYTLHAPNGATALSGFNAAAARQIHGVTSVQPLTKIGEATKWQMGAKGAIAVLSGEAGSLDSLASVALEIEEQVFAQYVF